MTEKEFTFDFRWFDRLTLKDREDYENLCHEAYDDMLAGGALRTDTNGKLMVYIDEETGERFPLRVMKSSMLNAFIYIMKRTDDPNITFQDIQNLPSSIVDDINRKKAEMQKQAEADAKKEVGKVQGEKK